jgi:hypothetical protein
MTQPQQKPVVKCEGDTQREENPIMSNRTIVAILAVLGLLVLVVAVQPVFACTEGCTPGYWKQPHHEDSWPAGGPDPGDYLDDLLGCGPHITLRDALWLKGGGENAFYRHAVAGILNLEAGLDYKDADFVWDQVARGCNGDYEGAKDLFEPWNEIGCPLD